jgi:hypothetical protein
MEQKNRTETVGQKRVKTFVKMTTKKWSYCHADTAPIR